MQPARVVVKAVIESATLNESPYKHQVSIEVRAGDGEPTPCFERLEYCDRKPNQREDKTDGRRFHVSFDGRNAPRPTPRGRENEQDAKSPSG